MRIAVSRGIQSEAEVWTADLSQGQFTRLGPGSDPVWTPDGRSLILYRSSPAPGIYKIALGQTSGEQLVNRISYPRDITADGRWLLASNTPHDLTLFDLNNRGQQIKLAQVSPAVGLYDAQFSPDGRWIGYTAQSVPGQTDVYVARMPPTVERWQVSAHGGALARWRRDGKALLYSSGAQTIMSVDVSADFPSRAVARKLFDAPGSVLDYAVMPDERLLLIVALGDVTAPPLTVVSNWTSAIKSIKK